MKDWLLLLVSIDIVMIDVVFVGPLLVLNYVYGDSWYEPNYENPPSTNVIYFHFIIGVSRSEPHINHTYEKIAVLMYVTMYVCMHVCMW